MKQRVRLLFLVPFLTAAMMIAMLAVPLSASAASGSNGKGHIMQLKTTHAQSQPQARSNNLQYHGGPVMGGTAHVFAIFWEPTGSTISSGYNSLIQRYFNDIGGSTDYVIASQYHDSAGNHPQNSVLSGTFVDTRAYPSNPMFDSDIQSEVSHAQSVNGWTSSGSNIFFVFTAKNENECFDTTQSQCTFTTFCAYHSNFGSTLYAFLPYAGTSLAGCGVPVSPNNNIDADSTINVTSHEQIEAATDPMGTAWFDRSGQEIGDKCNFNFGATNSHNGDITINGDTYEIQKEWDNAKSSCQLTNP